MPDEPAEPAASAEPTSTSQGDGPAAGGGLPFAMTPEPGAPPDSGTAPPNDTGRKFQEGVDDKAARRSGSETGRGKRHGDDG